MPTGRKDRPEKHAHAVKSKSELFIDGRDSLIRDRTSFTANETESIGRDDLLCYSPHYFTNTIVRRYVMR